MSRSRRRPWGPILVGALVLVLVGYYLAAEVIWRQPELASDSETAIVQPAEVPPPGGAVPSTAPPVAQDGDNPALRGQSAVRGDGTPLNDSTASPQPTQDQ